tara:strand:+ start:259 stop:525 length:267 start_codon:yes stop_codon:yes gene_type:complete
MNSKDLDLLQDPLFDTKFEELINEITDYVGDERVPLLEVVEYAEITADRIFADIEVDGLDGDIATQKMMRIDRIAMSAMREFTNIEVD